MKLTATTLLAIIFAININAQSLAFKQNNSSYEKFKTTTNFAQNFGSEKKSVGLGILYSVLLPGMGELYAGDYSIGKYFTMTDVALWLTLYGVNYYGDMKRDDYIAFAQLHAGVNPSGKDDTYWGTIGNYDNINIYNDEMELMREYDKVYDLNTHFWSWDEVANRKKYRSMRNSSETAYNNVKFVVSALILNRVASAVNAVITVKKQNAAVEESSMNFGVGVSYLGNEAVGLTLNFAGRF